ncbi:MAG: hypothetical protein ABL962_09015 [Fimbriimonadaceae bacterium]
MDLRYRCKELGELLFEGAEAFSARIPHGFPVAVSSQPPNFLRSVDYTGTRAIPATDAAERLSLFGIIDAEVIAANEVASIPFAFLSSVADEMASGITEGTLPRLLIHSELGNGKTVLLEQLKYKLWAQRIPVFQLDDRGADRNSLLRYLREIDGSAVLVVDNAELSLSDLIHVADGLENTKVSLVYLCRSPYFELAAEDRQTINAKFDVRKLGPIATSTFGALDKAYRHYGLWGDLASRGQEARKDYVFKSCKGEFRSIALGHFHQQKLEERVKSELGDIRKDEGAYRLLLVALLFSLVGNDPKAFVLSKLVPDTSYKRGSEAFRYGNYNVCFIREGRFFVPSSVFAREIVERHVGNDALADVIEDVFIRSSQYGYFEFRQLRKELMQFGALQRVFRVHDVKGNISDVVGLYRRLSETGIEENNVHFWHQYSIALYVGGEYVLSQSRLDYARSKASGSDDYDYFMLDHHQARLFLRARQVDPSAYDDHTDRMLDSIEIMIRLIGDPERPLDRDPLNLPEHLVEYLESSAGDRIAYSKEIVGALTRLSAVISLRRSNPQVSSSLIRRAKRYTDRTLELLELRRA